MTAPATNFLGKINTMINLTWSTCKFYIDNKDNFGIFELPILYVHRTLNKHTLFAQQTICFFSTSSFSELPVFTTQKRIFTWCHRKQSLVNNLLSTCSFMKLAQTGGKRRSTVHHLLSPDCDWLNGFTVHAVVVSPPAVIGQKHHAVVSPVAVIGQKHCAVVSPLAVIDQIVTVHIPKYKIRMKTGVHMYGEKRGGGG